MTQDEMLRRATGELESRGIAYFVVGSIASMAYGEPRFTRDIDIVVDLNAVQADELCAAFPAAEFYVSRAAAREAVDQGGQFNVICPTSGDKIDFIMVRRDAWGRSQLERRRRVAIAKDLEVYAASPEDVILGKLIYFHEGESDKHLRDIAAMLQISGDDIDQSYIEHWTKELSLEEPWNLARQRAGRSAS